VFDGHRGLGEGLTAEIAETAEEGCGVEITGCLAGERAIYLMKAV